MVGWKRFIRNYLSFNKRERRGAIILAALLIGLVSFNVYLYLLPEQAISLTPEQKAVIADFESFQETARHSADRNHSNSKGDTLQITPKWTLINPNECTVSELVSTGMAKHIAERIMKYRSKGGAFKNAEDLRKIYGIDTAWLQEAAPYLVFPENKHSTAEDIVMNENAVPSKSSKATTWIELDLNKADSASLVQIPGVGPYYAKSIVKLRSSLGGIIAYEQLESIYKIRPETIDQIRKHTVIDLANVQRINLNTCSVDELGRHPYMSWKLAKIVIRYREQHGKFEDVASIRATSVIDDSLYVKIAPYLSVE